MTPSFDNGGSSLGPGTGRMALVLGLALVLNAVLLAAPFVLGSQGDRAVAAGPPARPLATPAAAPAIQLPQSQPAAPRRAELPEQLETPAIEQPTVETIVGDEPTNPVVVVSPAPADPIARVESPARFDTQEHPDPVPPASAVELATDSPASLALTDPVEFSLVPPPAPMPDFDPCLLEIVNPADTNGPVHFVIEGTVHTLLPGETRQWLALSRRTVEFHRGDDLGDAAYEVERGTWRFQVTDAGWELVAAEHVTMFASEMTEPAQP